jgi:hypothetical protein
MPQDELSAYLVEIEPRANTGEAGSLASRARGSADGVRFLRSIYVPEDDRWFLLYEGVSAEEVAAAARRADAIVVSIAEARVFRARSRSSPMVPRRQRARLVGVQDSSGESTKPAQGGSTRSWRRTDEPS